MANDPATAQTIHSWLQARMPAACPLCQAANSWTRSMPFRVTHVPGQLSPSHPSVPIPESFFVSVHCQACGYAVLFSTIPMGVNDRLAAP